MKRISQLKDEALEALHGNFGKAVLATLGVIAISIAINFVFSALSGTNILDYYSALLKNDFNALMAASGGSVLVPILQILVALFFTSPLGVGVANAYRALYESKGSDNTLFKNFFKLAFGKKYGHIILVNIVSGLLITLMIVPVYVVLSLFIFLLHNPVVTIIMALLSLVFIIWIGLMYSQIKYIILDNPELDIIDTMRRSRHLMDGNKWRYILMILSFLGWILLGILTLCIGYLWLIPYINTTEGAFYCDIRDAEKVAAE